MDSKRSKKLECDVHLHIIMEPRILQQQTCWLDTNRQKTHRFGHSSSIRIICTDLRTKHSIVRPPALANDKLKKSTSHVIVFSISMFHQMCYNFKQNSFIYFPAQNMFFKVQSLNLVCSSFWEKKRIWIRSGWMYIAFTKR